MPQFAVPFSHSGVPFHIPGASVHYGNGPIAPVIFHPPAEAIRKAAKSRTGAATATKNPYSSDKALADFSAAEQEHSPFSSAAAARAFLEEAHSLVKAHLSEDAEETQQASENTKALEQARADARAYNESKKGVR